MIRLDIELIYISDFLSLAYSKTFTLLLHSLYLEGDEIVGSIVAPCSLLGADLNINTNTGDDPIATVSFLCSNRITPLVA